MGRTARRSTPGAIRSGPPARCRPQLPAPTARRTSATRAYTADPSRTPPDDEGKTHRGGARPGASSLRGCLTSTRVCLLGWMRRAGTSYRDRHRGRRLAGRGPRTGRHGAAFAGARAGHPDPQPAHALPRSAARSEGAQERQALAFAVVWIASPIDLVPEFIPVAGPLDDAIVAALVLRHLLRRTDRSVVFEHWRGDGAPLSAIVSFGPA